MPAGHNRSRRLQITQLSALLQQPHNCESTESVAARIHDALDELAPCKQPHRDRHHVAHRKALHAAAVAHVGVILQAAGWLARAAFRHVHPPEVQEQLQITYVWAITLATKCLQQENKVKLEQLRQALQPCPEDGVTLGGHRVAPAPAQHHNVPCTRFNSLKLQ